MASMKAQSSTGLPSDASFTSFYVNIDNLTQNTNNYEYIGILKDITKRHWKPVENRTCCFNNACRKQFSTLSKRPNHCRSCGEVFCNECLIYNRRLNKLANPDPDGDFYKVCKACFEEGKIDDVGQSRSHYELFKNIQASSKMSNSFEWRSHINIDREIQRLITGFGRSIGSSELQCKLHELKSLVTTPDWQKSSVWMKETLSNCCQFCKVTFGMLSKKLFCRVCGIVVCKSHSSNDLLLYISDEDKEALNPKWAIIKIVGCPSVEPEISLYMRVCNSCQDKLATKQAEAYQEEEGSVLKGSDFMNVLSKVNQQLHKCESEVMNQLPKFSEIVNSLSDRSRKSNHQNNMKSLAKSQKDLADVLSQHVTTIQLLKKLNPGTLLQEKLLKQYITAKCNFYLEHMSMFRTLKHKLSEAVSAETLETVQRIMDKNAIISTHYYLRQLVYETIVLCGRFSLEEDMLRFLIGIEEQVEADVKQCLQADKEDVSKHMEIVKKMIKENLEEKKNKIIKPSNALIKLEGASYVHKLITSRVEQILSQVHMKLELATALQSFPTTKKLLMDGLEKLKQKRQQLTQEVDDFVFVERNNLKSMW